MKILIAIMFLSLIGCTDARFDNVLSYGKSADVTCYSGGEVIFSTRTTGKVVEIDGGGWSFRDVNGRYVQTFADCFVVVD